MIHSALLSQLNLDDGTIPGAVLTRRHLGDLTGSFADGAAFQRAHQRPVGRYQVLGERSSGTNYLSALLRLNTLAEPTTDYGWKHGFIQFQAVLRTDLLVVVVREPLSWLRSM